MAVDTGPADGRAGDLPPEVVADVLDSPRRRAVLRALAERGEPVALVDVAAIVGASEDAGDAVDDRSVAVREDIYQRHLPKLTATGVVDYDSMRGTLELADPEVAERAAGER